MRLIPPLEQLGHVESRAEQRVAALLNQIRSGRPETCLYSVHLPRHQYKQMSEVDFVIVYDDLVLVVEVKGGRVGRRDGVWTFTDRFGDVHEKREGPFEQARSAMFALRKRIQSALPRADVSYGYLVITPDQSLGRDVEWEPQHHVGPAGMTVAGLSAALETARRFWLGEGRRSAGGAYGELLSVLRPDFDRVPSLAARSASLEEGFIRLADRQYDLLLGAERNPRILCLGGAGSGKTLLAVETARRSAAAGSRVVLTCRSRALAAMLTQAVADTSVVCVPFSGLPNIGKAEVLVVDEAQDLLDLESSLLLDAAVEGGWSNGRWRVFCDPNNQANVDGGFDRAVFDELAAEAMVIDLPFNCRNTSTVVLQTQLVTGADLGVARAGQGPAVTYRTCADDATTAALLDAHLRLLRQEEVDLADVVVVTVRDSPQDSAALMTKAHRKGQLVADEDSAHPRTPGAARLVTAAGIKGLEAAHVCVVDVDDVRDAVARARLYVSMTRPRISLWVGLSERAWAQVAEGADVGGGA